MTPQEQVKSLTDKIISCLCRITERPDGWLPHIVYVEEEGDYPVYNRYELIDYAPDGSCTLYNPRTDSRENNFHLSEINIDWLVTIWNRYIELCTEQGMRKDRAAEILQEEATANENSPRQLYAFLWSCNYMNRNISDEEIIEAWDNGPSRSKTDEDDDELYEVEKLTPDELAERINDENFAFAEDYIRFIEIKE